MNREFQDLVPGEADGTLRFDLVDRQGATALAGVTARLSTPARRTGDRWTAAAANLLLRLDENGSPVIAIPPAAVGGLAPCTHRRTGSVHALEGTGPDLRFVASADWQQGDTMTLNGRAVTPHSLCGQPLWPGFFKAGSVVICHLNGSTLTFSGGGSLSSADKDTVRQWMVEGHSVQGGSAAGTIPVRTGFENTLPMLHTEGIVLPAGYYARPITVKPVYTTNTLVTDFSGTGPFGNGVPFSQCIDRGCDTLTGWHADASGVSIEQRLDSLNGCEPTNSGTALVAFRNPFEHDWDYLIAEGSCTYEACIWFSEQPVEKKAVQDPLWKLPGPMIPKGDFKWRVECTPSARYLNVGTKTHGAPAWGSTKSSVTVTRITFHKRAV